MELINGFIYLGHKYEPWEVVMEFKKKMKSHGKVNVK